MDKGTIAAYEKKTRGSKTLYERAKKVMPGGVSHNLRFSPPYPTYVKEAFGPRFIDVDGNEYIDLWMGHTALILGHNPPHIVEALQRAVAEGTQWGIVSDIQVEFAELVCEIVPCAEKVRFCCSGTEATMYALRLARAFTGRNVTLKIPGGWHGASTDLTAAVFPPFDKVESAGLPPGVTEYTRTIPFNDLDGARRVIEQNADDLAAVIIEPVIGAGGLVPASIEYLKMLREETERVGAVLIFDEVITGFRLALGGAQEEFGVTPDLVTLGKIIGGGLPMGAVAGRHDVMDVCNAMTPTNKWERALIGGGTFSCNPLSVTAGMEMLKTLRKDKDTIYPKLSEYGARLRRGIEHALNENGVLATCTGYGSLFATHFFRENKVEITSPEDAFLKTDHSMNAEFTLGMANHGIFMKHGGEVVSNAHKDDDIELIIDAATEVAADMARAKKK